MEGYGWIGAACHMVGSRHPCSYHGVRPSDVVKEVLSRYLVQTTQTRIVAYRRYRESSVGYLSGPKIGRLHWEYLYERATELPEQSIAEDADNIRMPHPTKTTKTRAYMSALQSIRRGLRHS